MARTHVSIAAELVEEIDRVAGERGRSRFLEDAAREKLERIELEKALSSTKGIVRGSRYRHWKDRETTSKWVDRARRSGDDT
jgi:metal-responsive CopG/Arc/MetJ family transcriptional regulator